MSSKKTLTERKNGGIYSHIRKKYRVKTAEERAWRYSMKRIAVILLLLFSSPVFALTVEYEGFTDAKRNEIESCLDKVKKDNPKIVNSPAYQQTVVKLKMTTDTNKFDHITRERVNGSAHVPYDSLKYNPPLKYVDENGLHKGIPAFDLSTFSDNLIDSLSCTLSPTIIITSDTGTVTFNTSFIFTFETKGKKTLYYKPYGDAFYGARINCISYKASGYPCDASPEDIKRVYDFWKIKPQ